MDESAASDSVPVSFKLRLGQESFSVEAEVPGGPARVVDLLPVIQPLANAVVQAAVRQGMAGGAEVSCRPCCGACCRQPVPIAHSEARRLTQILARLPEERRRAVETRFETAVEDLDTHGLLERVGAFADLDEADDRQELALEYFRLGIACPFLEDESCSIHPHRPLACREYLVTSPAERCACPTPEGIEMVPIPARPSVALFRLSEGGDVGPAQSLLLVLAREWCQAHPDPEPASLPGPELFERFLRGM